MTLSSDEKRNCIENHTGTHKLTVEVYRIILPDLKNDKGKPEMKKSAYQDALSRILEDESRKEELFARINGDVVETHQEITIHTPSDESSSSNKSTVYPQDTRVLNSHTKCQTQIDELKELIQGLQAELDKKNAKIDKLEAMLDMMQQVVYQQYSNVQEAKSDEESDRDEESDSEEESDCKQSN